MKKEIKRFFTEKKEQKEKPKISIDVVFTPHWTAKDAEKIVKKIKKCDVYCPELRGWGEEQEKFLNEVSCGTISLKQLSIIGRYHFGIFFSFYEPILKALYRSRKIIKLIDVPSGHPINKLAEYAGKLYQEAMQLFFQGEIREAINTFKKHINLYTHFVREREKYIKNKLIEEISQINKNSGLKNKKEINVLLSLGILHTRVYHQIKEKIPAKREFSHLPFLYGPPLSLIRKKLFFPEKKIKDKEIIEAIILNEIFRLLSKFTKDTDKIVKVGLYILKQKKIDLKRIEKIKNFSEILENYKDIIPQSNNEFRILLDKIKK
ncbi:hypothetical protein J7K86_01110 [bacterium]|nr:hypothetical protein [bacterium]